MAPVRSGCPICTKTKIFPIVTFFIFTSPTETLTFPTNMVIFPISVSTLPAPAFTSPPPMVTVGSETPLVVVVGGAEESCRLRRWRKLPSLAVWVADIGGEMVDVPVPVLVEMDVAAEDALNALIGLAPGRGTETMIVMFPMTIFSMSILPTEMVTFVTVRLIFPNLVVIFPSVSPTLGKLTPTVASPPSSPSARLSSAVCRTQIGGPASISDSTVWPAVRQREKKRV